MRVRFLCLSLTATILSACAQFEALMLQDNGPKTEIAYSLPEQGWWQEFNDPLMNTLAKDLLSQNLDIQIARARVAEARGLAQSMNAGFFPDIAATATSSRSNTQIGVTKPVSIAQGGFDAAWEIDVFGQTAAKVDAANQRVVGSMARAEDITNSVLAELMRAVVALRQAQLTVSETKALLATQDEQILLIKARANAGLIDRSILTRAEAERAQTATQLPLANASLDGARYQIERLMGKPSGVLQALFDTQPAELFVPPAEQAISVTLEAMRQRPDIRAARADMLAAQSDLAKAEADVWPKISLKAFFGAQDGSAGLPIASNPVWSLASGISAPLLNFGRLRGAVNTADARANAAMLAYENASLTALQETNTALSDYLNGINALRDQEVALAARRETVALATERYTNGLTDKTDITTAQAELNQATLLLVTRKAAAANAYIRLQKALGSPFYTPEPQGETQ
jgi:NodT family efflux transporter outer membrane factor (OMF) lipoprotein